MEILIATHNQAKFKRYKKILENISGVEIISLSDLGIKDKVDEIFDTNRENAIHKVSFYGELSGKLTLSIDEAVMTNFLPNNQQPGVYVRRFSGDKKELSDEEVIQAWKEIFKIYPQNNKEFIWNFALAYYNPDNKEMDVFEVEQVSYVAKNFSKKETNGYPMSAILSPFENGEAYLEISKEFHYKIDKKKFKNFIVNFKKWLINQGAF